MTDALKLFTDFWTTWGPWIGSALIPSILAGLSVSPKTAEAEHIVAKGWEYFKHVLSFLSIATFKDQPGTFQLPLKLSAVVKKSNGVPPTTPLVLILAMLIGSQFSCSWIKSNSSKAAQVAIDCSEASAKDLVPSLFPTIIDIAKHNSSNWKQQVEALGKEFGENALACSVKAAASALVSAIPQGGSGTSAPPEMMTGLNNVQGYLDARDWNFKE